MSATPQTEAQRLADALEKDKWHVTAVTLCRASDELRRLDAVEAERNELAAKLNDLIEINTYIKERRAQISHRLWLWAHEELSEPLKTRYFNIVANGKADIMEHPTYAQQYNGMKYRAEAAENERDQLRAQLALAAAKEREECAKVCERIDLEYEGEDVHATWCAAAIRARGEAV